MYWNICHIRGIQKPKCHGNASRYEKWDQRIFKIKKSRVHYVISELKIFLFLTHISEFPWKTLELPWKFRRSTTNSKASWQEDAQCLLRLTKIQLFHMESITVIPVLVHITPFQITFCQAATTSIKTQTHFYLSLVPSVQRSLIHSRQVKSLYY